MLILRATKKLRDRIGTLDLRAGEQSTTHSASGTPPGSHGDGADDAMIAAEVEQMSTCRIAPTANRSVVGIMTEFKFLADRRARELDDLQVWLAGTPCSPLYSTHTTPENAFLHQLSRHRQVRR